MNIYNHHHYLMANNDYINHWIVVVSHSILNTNLKLFNSLGFGVSSACICESILSIYIYIQEVSFKPFL